MGELLRNDEEGAYFAFNSSDGQVVAREGNSTLFLHNFENAGVDHLFVATEEDEEDNFRGIYLFRVAMNEYKPELFDQLAQELQDEHFDVLICDTPSENDQQVFNRAIEPYLGYEETGLEEILDES